MQPKFKNQLAWQQAELLMQPILIRVIDNLRQQIEVSNWQGTYQEVENPYPGYQLLLTKDNHTVNVDIWQLCFQICFTNYHPEMTDAIAEIDPNLIAETGDVNWNNLEIKTKGVIETVFTSLP